MKFLHYFYYRIYQAFITVSDDALNLFKPYYLIVIIELSLLLEGALWFTPLTGIKFDLNTVGLIIAGLVIFIGNYFLFPHERIIKQESKEFKYYSKLKRTLFDVMVVFILLGWLVFTIFSFYKFGQMDWSKYR